MQGIKKDARNTEMQDTALAFQGDQEAEISTRCSGNSLGI